MKKTGMLIVLIFVLPVLFASCGSSGGAGNSPSKTVEKAFDYYLKKDYKKMAVLYASADNQKLTKEELDKVESMLPFATQQDEKKGGIKNYEIEEETIADDGNSAKVKLLKKYKNGDEDTDRLSLIKIDGDWFIKVISN